MSSQPTLAGPVGPADAAGGPTDVPPAPSRGRSGAGRGPVRPGTLVKIALMAVVNALGVFGVLAAWREGHLGILAAMVVLVVVADWVYFSRRTTPLKYILPGLAFLLVFQVYVVGYTGWVAFTNYGDGHNSTKEHAVEALLVQNERRVEGSATYPLAVVERGDELGFAIIDGGDVLVGTAEQPLTVEPGARAEDGRVTEVPGATVLDRGEVLARQSEVTSLRVAFSDDPNDGSVRTQDARTGFLAVPTLEWDADADTMTDVTTGTVYRATSDGWFRSDDGQRLNVGWRVMVGLDNFRTAFADERYAGPFLRILVWTFAFAILSVVTTFLLGLFLAITFNDTRLRGRKAYRTLLILPYAIPGFLAALLWSGMLNRSYGFVNQVLLGGAAIPWLTDPWLAKLSVLGVNLWLGFPYMFLICTGALQSLPGDVLEAAKVDGASAWRTWRSVTLPLLLVATSPLLISSFAFNFNNFTLIYMLTGGGPRFADASVPLGHTDILISMVYSVSGLDGTAAKNYGLASALSIVIFLIVATISAITFKRTKQFEEIN
ncbi:binding-protein-dependent transport systems inner membrane component [Cellulomonas flavigena DSM 20109]|uniref:Maltose/maltodextrin transport system permease protein n=1 Tax=Cellulomonas flavigena (strain ATCC 482 / DSM 20109 / BCRC 11376 / JCM 18109 / NBRC 3775 / NCIMB 8073 / NRS 134) TaxID=446466 RepID=D5UG42_CELFN|nr:ABC transporter permease subunit [Cellulomonas flavigena]ADG75065.1 binding-protein-dependent transport systems inner membrane component [Cellulomonas flavigena DSM 20109]